ncbi:ATP-binding cassette domain-containing protein [Cytobacillus purgationiresistens]|uniref:ABC-2 type transport system ATP-binding protein n=1 Tax=Cytobacillus purgationiresistens TaxID=863449 RepID=A0ABU0APK1_9BACI|nr:ABC transporter ATP-binding protein [Cytobacillus purgationiresistens]MDQ0273219.1 ABC-2 type transport system ATP-binding protein [Cytobacillus purgationiresistens]
METWIKVKGLEKKLDGFKLGPLDVEFESGTIHVIVGNNGSGKSTLFKQMMNLVTYDKGQIEVMGYSVDGKEESWKKKIAYQPQTLIGCVEFTGNQLQQIISPMYSNWDQSLFSRIVEMLNLPLDRKYGKLSQGVQQKLSIALTLARDTDILLLDEPTAHMDIPSKRLLMDLFVEWMERGEKLMVISSHQTEDIRKLADYLLLMRDGQLIGKYLKEDLSSSHKRYWLAQQLPVEKVPGEIERKNERMVVTSSAEEAESFFEARQINWLEAEALDIDEIVSYMLGGGRQ